MNRLFRLEIWIWNNISEDYEIISEGYEIISEDYRNISEDYEIVSEDYWNISEGFYSAARPERAEAPSPGQHPGYKIAFSNAPCKGKSFNHSKNKQLKNQIR